MSFTEFYFMLQRLNDLISRKATGTPEQLAHKLGKSVASVHRYISDLKSLGAPIEYCSRQKTYYFKEDYKLQI